jgi:trimeric autotransporter adhesin
MTTHLIDDDSDDTTAASTPAFTLGSSDNLILTSAGQLLATGSNSNALVIDGVSNEATIQGLVYGTNDGIAVSSSTGATLYVDSDVSGENTGIHVTGSAATDFLTIEAGGIVQGGSDDGIFAGADVDGITVYGSVSGTNYGINANSGFATVTVEAGGSVSGETAGILLSTGLSSAQLTIDGSVSSDNDTGVLVEANQATMTVNGQVDGYSEGILSSGSGNSITVDGAVQGEAGNGVSISGSGTALFVNGEVQANSSDNAINVVNNVGPIDDETIYIGVKGDVAAGVGILLDEANVASITNDGHVTGAVIGLESVNSQNLAFINDGTLSSVGTISTAQALVLSNDTGAVIHNAGLIASIFEAFLIAGGSTAAIENTGTIEGALLVVDTSAVDVENAGVWVSSIGLDFGGSGDNTLTNSGRIHGPIEMGTGADTLTNTGTITSSVTFTGTGDSLTNGGAIHGLVTMGTTDTFINTGTVHGSVVLGTGDTFNSSAGDITGTVTAAASDTFDYSGSFGHNTIAGFVSVGTTHDIISFASDDFANYAAVQAHMAQVGTDVVITLDAGDTIVLTHQTLAHLVAHDFAFT